ncbi:ABC transporter ATP-binding protein [Clostridium algidicarnis]|uniref:ABC transporter ATP-binding protein n=1 Tax=Clostridium algidicarnis TaxID=37659 RepID=UPI001628AA95|nr:ABC transporter ATP-binding protein [Clostridium algidicarnis]MBB6632059.1 ABC transporter ATP-binding protein [Clostridium algidicarnis]MBB6698416.1 ABC transporter ATP-binding protein [Clostridium algidicarnis]
MSEIIIKVDNFGKCYGDFKAVDGISFEVKSGEIFGIIGPNGAGKTTTLECLEGLRMIDSGTMEVLGLNPWKESRKIKNLIGVQLQSSSLPDTITVKESMELFSSYHKVKPRYDLLSRLGLGDKLKSQYHILSGGEKRRLAIALAVAHNPKVLILDEPTAALDVKARFELHKIIKELKDSGTTIILATHDMAEAEKMADRIAILLKGKIMVIGTPKEITAKGSALTKISVRTLGNSLEGIFSKAMDEYHIFYTDKPGYKVMEIINLIESKEDVLIDLRVERPSLEERFLEITSLGGGI